MNLPKLISSPRQLRKLIRKGPLENEQSWEEFGPCPDFIRSPAVQFTTAGESYVVFMHRRDFEAFRKDVKAKDEARDGGCIEG